MMRQYTTRSAPPHRPAVTARSRVTVQRKMSVSTPGDTYEREADRVADEVMRTPLDEGQRMTSSPPAVQRMCTGCEEEQGQRMTSSPPAVQRMCTDCEEEQQVQRAVDDGHDGEEGTLQGKREGAEPAHAPAGFGQQLASVRGGGAGTVLPAATRSIFEPRFGRSFDGVRVHDGAGAAALAGSVRARAFTVGRDIFFGAGQYAPQNERGQRLVAHELVHTIQQGGGDGGTVQRAADEQADAGDSVRDPRPLEVDFDASSALGPVQGGAAANEGAEVSRATGDAILDDPEGSAASEQPYQTGMPASALAGALGEGQPLDAGTRRSMELHGGSSPDVRIHTDAAAASLAARFGARAFTVDRHIAFASGGFAPGTDSGRRLLRHEITHAATQHATSPSAVFRAAACAKNCPPGTATAYSAVSSSRINCYGYATGNSAFIWPGEITSAAEPADARAVRRNPASTAADLARVLPYHSLSRIRANTDADLGAPISTDCTRCCFTNRKIIEVATADATTFRFGVNAAGRFIGWTPMINASDPWDFHWYRKDLDRSWSQKLGPAPSRQDDAAGSSPICNPCTAARNHSPFNYSNVIGSWCL
jgi:hypothetical protein